MKNRIAEQLAANGMTQVALASKVERSPGFISEIISGKKDASIETLEKIAETLGCSVSDLLSSSKPLGGLAESTVEFIQAPASRLSMIARALGVMPHHPTLIKSTASAPMLGILSGDMLLSDLAPPLDRKGVVIATEFAPETDSGRSYIARHSEGWLLPADPALDPVKAGENHIIRAVVLASYRSFDNL